MPKRLRRPTLTKCKPDNALALNLLSSIHSVEKISGSSADTLAFGNREMKVMAGLIPAFAEMGNSDSLTT